MVGVLVLLYRLLRRLGASTLGAIAGSSIFLVAPAATRGWVQLTMAEPLGTLLLLALCLTIIPPGPSRKNRWRWPAAALLVAGIILSKEMLAATLSLPLGLALITDQEGRLRGPALRRHAKQTLALFVGVGVVCGGALAVVMLAVPRDGYYLTYGQSLRPVTDTALIWLATFSPVDPVRGLPRPALTAALALLALLVVTGCCLMLRTTRPNSSCRWLIALAVAFPLIGALAYAPWPAYLAFYAIPYLIGASILIALAMTGLQRASHWSAPATAYAYWGALLLVGAAGSHWEANSTAALQRLNFRLVTRIAADSATNSVLFATRNVDSLAWRGPAGTMKRYATAMQVTWPPAHDVPCPTRPPVAGQVVIYRDGLCPDPEIAVPIVEHYSRMSLRRLGFVADSVRILLDASSIPRALRP
jgi:hypothetical protein